MKFLNIFFISLALLFSLTTCTDQETTAPPTPPASGSETGNTNTEPQDNSWVLNCALPACEGENCCSKEDENCDDWCTGEEYLRLSGDLGTKCLALNKNTVDNLNNIFTDVLKIPTQEKLDNLDEEDMGLICGTLKELSSELLKIRLDKYSIEQAKEMLAWIIKNPAVTEIFENAKDAIGREMIKTLLKKASNTPGDQGVLTGLELKLANETNNILFTANKNKNQSFIRYIHQAIIVSNNGLCSGNNPPSPTTHYPNRTKAQDFKEQACVLALYCKVAPPDDTKNSDFRKDIARIANNENIIYFLKTSFREGGLNGDGNLAIPVMDVERWPDKACHNLRHFWDNGGLVLGL